MNVVALRVCNRCGRAMSSVAEIAPFASSPGLVAFVCIGCGAADSVLFRAGGERRNSNAGRSSETASERRL
jgi:hypothetical protein